MRITDKLITKQKLINFTQTFPRWSENKIET